MFRFGRTSLPQMSGWDMPGGSAEGPLPRKPQFALAGKGSDAPSKATNRPKIMSHLYICDTARQARPLPDPRCFAAPRVPRACTLDIAARKGLVICTLHIEHAPESGSGPEPGLIPRFNTPLYRCPASIAG